MITQVQIFLADKDITDLQSLDATLTDFLSLGALRSDMESFRDEIIEYYLQDDGVGAGGGDGSGGVGDQEEEDAEMEQKGDQGQ